MDGRVMPDFRRCLSFRGGSIHLLKAVKMTSTDAPEGQNNLAQRFSAGNAVSVNSRRIVRSHDLAAVERIFGKPLEKRFWEEHDFSRADKTTKNCGFSR